MKRRLPIQPDPRREVPPTRATPARPARLVPAFDGEEADVWQRPPSAGGRALCQHLKSDSIS